MIYFLLRLMLLALIILGISHLIPGIEVQNFGAALLFAFILGLVNAFLRPLLILLSLPITVITLGIFALFVNAFTFWLASLMSFGVHVTTLAGAFFGGAIVWLASLLTNQWIYIDTTDRRP